MTESAIVQHRARYRITRFVQLAKPRVVALIVFCAAIGMLLASQGTVPLRLLIAATTGIGLVAGAAAAVNCLIERKIDAVMARTRGRPLPMGDVDSCETCLFSGAIGGLGLSLLYVYVNPLTMWLTLATFVGYAVIYTVLLKPLTPQNIVIGGASGAMPPVLGWAAVTGEVPSQAWALFLIILVWTPPHFWSLALYRVKEYAAANVPMLPVTHGREFTQARVFAYTVALALVTLVPFMIGMSGRLYVVSATILNLIFIGHSWRVWRRFTDRQAQRTFRYSINYLTLLFAALLIDHYMS